MLKKIFIQRQLIYWTLFLMCKYLLLRTLLTDKKFLTYLTYKKNAEIIDSSQKQMMQPYRKLIGTVNRVLISIYPKGNCLIKTLVIRDILKMHGYTENINLGVNSTDQGLKAHAWLDSENVYKYKIVHLL